MSGILMAPVKDGQIVETDSQTSLKKALNSDNNGMDKDAFLQLLVAQMQYQDPLEPTSNTEYISQYAQFSQVEQMQNLAATSELARASSLVGKEVYVKTAGSEGVIYGKVDYVVFENNKAYLAIDESLYSLEDLDTVVDLDYKNAFDKAYNFNIALNKLPNVNSVDLSNAEDIDELEKIYNEMTDYEKSFVASDNVKKLNQYIERLKEVRAVADQVNKEENGGEGSGTEEVEDGEESGTEEVEGA